MAPRRSCCTRVPGAFVDVWPWQLDAAVRPRALPPMLCLPGVPRDRDRPRPPPVRPCGAPLVAQAVALVAMLGRHCGPDEADLTGPAASVALAWLVVAGSLAGTAAMLLAFR